MANRQQKAINTHKCQISISYHIKIKVITQTLKIHLFNMEMHRICQKHRDLVRNKSSLHIFSEFPFFATS